MITVIATVRNKAAWIVDSIESLLDQTYKDYEILFIDDNSTDGTDQLLKFYSKKSEKFRYLTLKRHKGCSVALNLATQEAKGDIIVVASGDDYYTPKRLFLHHKGLKECDIHYGKFAVCDHRLGFLYWKDAKRYNKKELLKVNNQYVPHGFMALKRSVALKHPYDETIKVGIDHPFLCSLASGKYKWGFTNESLGKYRILPTGVSATDRYKIFQQDKKKVK